VASAKAKPKQKSYVDAFANALAVFAASRSDDVLPRIPQIMAADFESGRSELWLWDDSSRSAYLTYSSGKDAGHRHDYAPEGEGAVGKIAQSRKPIENIVLSTFGGEDQEFARGLGFNHITAYPLVAREKLVGVLANYSSAPVPDELLAWWRMYSDVCAQRVQSALSSREKDRQITQLSLLFDATRLLNSTLDLAELLELILKIARGEVSADRGSVFLVDKKKQELWSIVAGDPGAVRARGRGSCGTDRRDDQYRRRLQAAVL
jgi:GAF domain-containing protein